MYTNKSVVEITVQFKTLTLHKHDKDIMQANTLLYDDQVVF